MSVKIRSVAPRARCYMCGSTEIATVCHHCGRAMCSSHGPERLPVTTGIHVLEFSDLDIRELQAGQPASHCTDCLHYVKEPAPWLISQNWGVLFAIGSIGSIVYGLAEPNYRWAIVLGIIGFILGVIIVFVQRVLKPRSLHHQMLAQQPRFPMLGSFKANMRERVDGKISLSDMGEYIVSTNPPKGKLEYSLSLTPRNKDQLGLFIQKYEIEEKASIPTDGGTVIIRGRPNLTYDNPDESILGEQAQTIILRSHTHQFPFLADSTQRDRDWIVSHEYKVFSDIIPSSGRDALPFAIVPTLVMEGAHRAVMIDINILEAAAFPQLREMVKIERLTVDVPASLGQVRNSSPSTRTSRKSSGDDELAMQQVIWRDLPVTNDDQARRRKSFYLSFENSVKPEMVFKGHVSIQFKGTVSGADGVSYFNPLGITQRIEDLYSTSWVEVDFDLSFESLRFQEDVSFQDTFSQENILLTYQVITELTDALSKQGFYFKQSIENPETTSPRRAYAVNRYWDIEGRLYQGVYPIDFHLILKGEAALRPQEDGFVGEATAEISVKGTVTNADMRNEVKSVFDQLTHNTKSILERISDVQSQAAPDYSIPGMAGSVDQPQFSGSSISNPYSFAAMDGNSLQSITQTVRSAIQDFFKGIMVVSIPSDGISRQPADDSTTLELSHQERLKRLLNALLNGYISENMYQKLRAEIEAEMGSAGMEGNT